MDLSLWFLLPTAVVIAVLAMSSGVSGSNFWIPVYLIWLDFDPAVGFWLSLLTMLFGFGSGTVKNLRAKTFDSTLYRTYLAYCLPAGVIGGIISPFAPGQILIFTFAFIVMVFGLWQISLGIREKKPPPPLPGAAWRVALFGGFLQGLIATGLGKMIMPCCLRYRSLNHHADAVGTTVLLVFTVSLGAVLARLNGEFVGTLVEQADLITAVMIWVAPGAVLGGQIGPKVAHQLPYRFVKPYAGTLLLLVSVLMFIRVFG